MMQKHVHVHYLHRSFLVPTGISASQFSGRETVNHLNGVIFCLERSSNVSGYSKCTFRVYIHHLIPLTTL